MTFRVRELRRAQADIRQIVNWLAERSPQGARAWLDAYDAMVARLEKNADTFGPAEENDELEFDVCQAPLKTRRGRVYRALFFIRGDEAFILSAREARGPRVAFSLRGRCLSKPAHAASRAITTDLAGL